MTRGRPQAAHRPSATDLRVRLLDLIGMSEPDPQYVPNRRWLGARLLDAYVAAVRSERMADDEATATHGRSHLDLPFASASSPLRTYCADEHGHQQPPEPAA